MAEKLFGSSNTAERAGPSEEETQAAAAAREQQQANPSLSVTAHSEDDFTPLSPTAPFDPSVISRRLVLLSGPSSGKLAFVLNNVLSKEECDAMIAATERLGYAAALVNVGYTQLLMQDVRNNMRCMVDSIPQTALIWDRIRPHVPALFQRRAVLGLNERLRFLRYDPEQQFCPHYDGIYRRANGEASALTVILYLNEGFDGGATRIFVEDDELGETIDIVPKTGSVLIFQHNILHEGSILVKGRKYIMRTDVMLESDE